MHHPYLPKSNTSKAASSSKITTSISSQLMSNHNALHSHSATVIAQLQSKLGNQQFGKWMNTYSSTPGSNSNQVIQRVRFLNQGNVKALEDAIQDTLSEMEENDESQTVEYQHLEAIFSNFSDGSLATETITEIRNLTQNSMMNELQVLDHFMESLITGNVRAANYPNGYSAAANLALTTYKNANQNPADPTQCLCPENGGHWVRKTDMTIDHRVAVASHWNNTGYNTNRATRNTWYSDVTNHDYCCRACNSAMGSGGIRYRMDTGAGYSG